MNHRIRRSNEEWMQLITSYRQSGLADREWCTANGIVVSSFYNAVVRLRKKACRIPEREQDGERSMILPQLPFRTSSRCPFFRKKRSMSLLPRGGGCAL